MQLSKSLVTMYNIVCHQKKHLPDRAKVFIRGDIAACTDGHYLVASREENEFGEHNIIDAPKSIPKKVDYDTVCKLDDNIYKGDHGFYELENKAEASPSPAIENMVQDESIYTNSISFNVKYLQDIYKVLIANKPDCKSVTFTIAGRNDPIFVTTEDDQDKGAILMPTRHDSAIEQNVKLVNALLKEFGENKNDVNSTENAE